MEKLRRFTDEATTILREIKLGNSFLFTGSFTILISIFISSNYTIIGLKIGVITLIFGGVFRLLNILTKLLVEVKKETDAPKQHFLFWGILRFSIWIGTLIIYIFWINTVIQIIPTL